MDYEELVAQLSNHANMGDENPELLERSFVFGLWQAARSGDLGNLAERTDNLLSCLDGINQYLNGKEPSRGVSNPTEVPTELAYPAAEIVAQSIGYVLQWKHDARFAGAPLKRLELAIWQISAAWAAVLAGDIDSISEHLKIEITTKNLEE